MSASNKNTFHQNSEYLLKILLEENKHINLIDFIDNDNKATNFSCVTTAFAIGEKYKEIIASFTDNNIFTSLYFTIYASALENYHYIVGNNIRQIFIDEAKIFYPNSMTTITFPNLTDPISKAQFMDLINNNRTYIIILRDEITFIIIHYDDNNKIIIDPHIEYCGILSNDAAYKYIVYDGIWNFDVSIMIGENNDQSINIIKTNEENENIDLINTVDPINPINPIDPIDPINPINPINPVNHIDPINPVIQSF